MRNARFGGLGMLAALAIPTLAAAQSPPGSYPDKPVKIIVPFAPAGPTDVVARLIATKLSERSGKQFYIENVVGAGGNTGMGQAARAARGRLYDPVRVVELRGQSEPLPENPLRPLQGFHPRHGRRRRAQHPAGPSFGAGEDRRAS